MRTRQSKTYFVFFLAMLFLAGGFSASASIKKKEIKQSYGVGSNDQLRIENRFGNLTVTHWNKSEVSIRVEIECKASSDSHAQENLDRIRIEMKKEMGVVSAITTIQEKKGNSNNESMTINYYIQMPSWLVADLTQMYGNINLPEENNGKMDIHLKYGNLNAGNFTANVTVEAKYGNVEMGVLNEANMDFSYVGKANIKGAKVLDVDSKYSNLKIGDAGSLRMEMKYGNLALENGETVDMGIKYSDVTINTLKKSLMISELGYGNVKIQNLSPSFKEIHVEAHYGNLDVSVPSNAAFRVVAEGMKYSNCEVKGFNVTKKNVDDDDETYTYEINGGKQSVIRFEGNKYGNLKVRAN